ncbi:DUF2007 domain-containing protein [soil metagenome]
MKRLTSAPNLAIATLWADQMCAAGVKTTVQREYANGAVGHLPPDQTLPELWIEDELQMARAERLLHELQHPVHRLWACQACHEMVEGPFEQCWNCGAPMPV